MKGQKAPWAIIASVIGAVVVIEIVVFAVRRKKVQAQLLKCLEEH